jgi:hyperosmotically inducible protein
MLSKSTFLVVGLWAGALGSTTLLADGKTDAQKAAPDNSKKNEAIEAANAPTADDQSNAKSDVELVAAVRRAIIDDKALSTYAHNVKIVTKDGHVTLSGPVETEAERAAVTKHATQVAGAGKVTSNLEVAVH